MDVMFYSVTVSFLVSFIYSLSNMTICHKKPSFVTNPRTEEHKSACMPVHALPAGGRHGARADIS